MEQFGVKKALQLIVDGQQIKMSSTDFKSHIFKKNTGKFGKPIIHNIIKNVGHNMSLHLTYDEFLDKFKNNVFYVYDKL